MTSLRKKVSSYFRQLSFHNEPRERKNVNENTFINKYLTGQIKLKEGPPVLYGKTPNDLPNFEIGFYSTNSQDIVGCATGPSGGLTTVQRIEKHLSIIDSDIDFIDTQDEAAEIQQKAPLTQQKSHPFDNKTMQIKVAGQVYTVPTTNSSKVPSSNRKSRSLGSLTDLTLDNQSEVDTARCANNNEISAQCKNKNSDCDENISKAPANCDNLLDTKDSVKKGTDDVMNVDTNTAKNEEINKNYPLNKSKSAGHAFDNKKKGKIIRLAERPKPHDSQDEGSKSSNPSMLEHLEKLPDHWNKKTDLVYGMSDSLYDVNQVTKTRNGNPIADCFGIIARKDSALLALADGVNWGEKACIAAKSAIHGCLHYLSKTIFDDTSLFELDLLNPSKDFFAKNAPINTTFTSVTSPLSKSKTPVEGTPDSSSKDLENRIHNTNEIFISLLRAFNCAHNLILENQGMLTTLTVAVVLPLKNSNYKKTQQQNLSSSRIEDKHIVGNRNVTKVSTSSVPTTKTHNTPENQPQRNKTENPEKYICCVCNVGDTLAYVYSPKYGVREITKGSHDVHSVRDMRDALGALGPADGINPELNNLTLSVTTLDAGDIVMVASDGLSDNYDPTVCKYTVNSYTDSGNKHGKVNHPATQQHQTASHSKERQQPHSSRPPHQKPPRQSKIASNQQKTPIIPSNVSRLAKDGSPDMKNKENESANYDNPLIAQFVKDNAVENSGSSGSSNQDTVDNATVKSGAVPTVSTDSGRPAKPYRRVVSLVETKTENVLMEKQKNFNPLSKSSSTSRVKQQKISHAPNSSRIGFLRSKTSLDLHHNVQKQIVINRNDDGLPYVTPIQKYELTLLLMEDILKRGISGRDKPIVTAKLLCENLLRYTISVTAAKRRSLEDKLLYFDNKNDILVEISSREKKIRRRKCLEKIQNLPGKLDHVSVVAYNVGNTVFETEIEV